ncbi:uncharacterized protein LOC134812005 [Bolinopsis microptera]|uniref:uncharacterized protein LOC134812005 n=1 Tax=Bolinopsis microptera TaxID=2820187 RepID=UPI00307A393B
MLGAVAGDCVDSQDTCIHWAGLGYCDGGIYKTWMLENCRKSCNQCTPTPVDICKGPVGQDWTLTKVAYDLGKQELKSARHDIGCVTVSDGGSGSFSAAGSNVQSAKFTYKSGVKVLYGVKLNMVVPVVSDDGKPSISTKTQNLIAGQPNWSYSSYSGSWNCQAGPGQSKTCTAFVNKFDVTTPYTETWQAPGQVCSAESKGELVQELWGQPIVLN